MAEHYMQEQWDAAQWEHDAAVITVSAAFPEREWVPSPRGNGWVRRQDS